MAEALWRLRNGRARLLTTVGDDVDGRFLNDIAPGLLLEGKNGSGPAFKTPSHVKSTTTLI